MKRLVIALVLVPGASWGQSGAPFFYSLSQVAPSEWTAAFGAGEIVGCKIRPEKWGDEIVQYLTSRADEKYEAAMESGNVTIQPMPDEGIQGQFDEGEGDTSFLMKCPDIGSPDILSGLDGLIGWKA